LEDYSDIESSYDSEMENKLRDIQYNDDDDDDDDEDEDEDDEQEQDDIQIRHFMRFVLSFGGYQT